MEVLSRASVAMVAAVCFMLAAAFPAAAVTNVHVPAPAPSPSNYGMAIDQAVAYILMLVALVLTYIIH